MLSYIHLARLRSYDVNFQGIRAAKGFNVKSNNIFKLLSVIPKDDLNVSQRLVKSLTPEEHLAAIGFVHRDGWNRTQDLKEDSRYTINMVKSICYYVTQLTNANIKNIQLRIANEQCVFNLDHQYDQ